MDQSLDEIISSRPKTGRIRRRGSARQQVLGTSATPAGRARAAAVATTAAAPKPAATTNAIAEKIMVSNLPQDVNEAQIKELFHSTVGPLKEVTLHYDSAGRSKGVANVWFSRRGDGNKAYQQYNNRLIDGKRPMKIEILVDPSRPAPAATLASRVAPPPAPAAAVGVVATPSARTGRGPSRRGGRVGRGGGRKERVTPKSAADLDAEMEDYTASNGPAVASA